MRSQSGSANSIYVDAGTDFPDKIKVQDVNSDAVVEVRCNDDPLVGNI
jgi:hypothetical protein